MREFFKGWRRKAGCVALVVACAFTSLWVRSLSDGEIIATPLVIMSEHGTLYFGWNMRPFDRPILLKRAFGFGNGDRIRTSLWAIGRVNGGVDDMVNMWNLASIPHYLIVLPLTLLSAYLLPWQPRKRTESEHA